MLNRILLENYIFKNKNKIKINSKEIVKGDIFLALQGKNLHGNKFINQSINQGAKYCLTDKKTYKLNHYKNKICYFENTFLFLTKLAIKKRKLYKGKVIGITGSAGKTTLKETLRFFLKKQYKVSASYKSYNNILGVILSLLNLDLKSEYSIFELGTNNFGEIEKLVKLILPSQVFITNIQNTHLENFKNKRNIVNEKSNIFKSKYNPNIKSVIFLNNNKEESLLFDIAKKHNVDKILTVGKLKNNYCFIVSILKKNNEYLINLSINKKRLVIKTRSNVLHRIYNILFCLTFFYYNKLDIKIILDNLNKLKPVSGRGLIVNKLINNIKILFIDETYNANPDTMKQSIEYFYSMNSKGFIKILILGNMNELGKHSEKFHLEVLKFVEKYNFDSVILCGKFFELAISKIKKPFNKYIIKKNENDLIEFIKFDLHKNAMILAKCSNSSNVNKFGIKFINMKEGN